MERERARVKFGAGTKEEIDERERRGREEGREKENHINILGSVF